ncbi:MAG: AAA family ATPase, partial [Nanoarchaeota archaeon]
MKKIFILGNMGSGKSTLAKIISEKLEIKCYDLDDIFWTKKFDKKRSKKIRDKMFKELCDKDKWIIEGAYATWIEYGIKKAEVIILLKIPVKSLLWRITKRSIKREKKKNFGEERYQRSFKDYMNLIKATLKYYKREDGGGFHQHKKLIKKHKTEFIIIKI